MTKQMRTAYLTSAYLPPVEYFTKLTKYDRIVVEQCDHYCKQTYRNRCTIASPNGPQALTVPTVKPEALKAEMKDIVISEHGNWRHLHWNAIEAAYNSTPFFEYYKDDFRPFYEKRYELLSDFNRELLEMVCRLIDIEPVIEYSTEYKVEMEEGETDFREVIHPKKDFSVVDKEFKVKPYYQVFDSKLGFLPNMSIIDLLFNMGPESVLYL